MKKTSILILIMITFSIKASCQTILEEMFFPYILSADKIHERIQREGGIQFISGESVFYSEFDCGSLIYYIEEVNTLLTFYLSSSKKVNDKGKDLYPSAIKFTFLDKEYSSGMLERLYKEGRVLKKNEYNGIYGNEAYEGFLMQVDVIKNNPQYNIAHCIHVTFRGSLFEMVYSQVYILKNIKK